MVLNVRSTATSALLLVLAFSFTTFQTVHADGFAGTLTTLVTFGDSYSVQNVGDGRVQWPDWAAGYLDLKLFDYARSGATCSNALTPRAYPAVTEDELPAYWNDASNGTLGDIDYSTTLYSIWIGTNDVGAGCLLTGDQTPGVSIIDTTYCVIQWMRSLYEQGARNFIVQNMVPLQRAPMYQKDAYPTKYWTPAKNATEYNVFIESLVKSGNEIAALMLPYLAYELSDAHIGLFDSYGLFNDIMDHPENYLNGTVPYNVTGSVNPCIYPPGGSSPISCTTEATGDAIDSFVWYNELHVTNQVNRVVAREFANAVNGSGTPWISWI